MKTFHSSIICLASSILKGFPHLLALSQAVFYCHQESVIQRNVKDFYGIYPVSECLAIQYLYQIHPIVKC